MKYAILQTGGKQYIVSKNDTINIEKIESEDKEIKFDNVLAIWDEKEFLLGMPKLAGVTIKGSIIEQFKGPKITIFKYKPKKRYRRKTGHRQKYTKIKIIEIKSA